MPSLPWAHGLSCPPRCWAVGHTSGCIIFPLCLTLPPCRASIQPLHHLHGLTEIHREHRRLQVTLWDGGCKGTKNGILWGEWDSATFWELLVPCSLPAPAA